MSNQLDHFVVANAARIPCTVRTLRPFYVDGDLKPWCHLGELIDALLYLAKRAELPATEILALQGLLGKLSSLISDLSEQQDLRPVATTNILEP